MNDKPVVVSKAVTGMSYALGEAERALGEVLAYIDGSTYITPAKADTACMLDEMDAMWTRAITVSGFASRLRRHFLGEEPPSEEKCPPDA